jgi:DNA-binding NtrC family response regulator
LLTLLAQCYDNVINFPLRDDLKEITAGSLPDNGVYLPYKGISKRHFVLIRDDSRWTVRDLESTNGTTLNGERITESEIHDGDIIKVGSVQILVKAAQEDLEPAQLLKHGIFGGPKTDKIDSVSASTEGPSFSFPKLIFPENMILGGSKEMIAIYRKLHSYADSDVHVLFVGETGVGKEMFARTLHMSSKRSSGPFIDVNCAAIPTELAEAELFGIGEKVATDVDSRKGKMLLANGGSLFFDELSAFPLGLQAKILRAVEDKAIWPVGAQRPQQADFRIIAATNQDPQELIQAQMLRKDLYHRIAGTEIVIPPLRERKEDLKTLIPGLLENISRQENKKITGLTKRLYALICGYSYPGNVRELVNLLRAMLALAHPGEMLDIHLAPEKLLHVHEELRDVMERCLQEKPIQLHETVDEVTRKLIVHALRLHSGKVKKAAEHLKVTPFGLKKMMKRLGIDKEEP